jgi:hypothetical protein
MLFRAETLTAIGGGAVTVAFRRWRRPTVKAGGTLVTRVGVLAIDTVEVIDPDEVTDDDARRAGFASRGDVLAALAERAGDLYRVTFHRAGPDPRIAMRERDDLGADDVAARSRLAGAMSQRGGRRRARRRSQLRPVSSSQLTASARRSVVAT